MAGTFLNQFVKAGGNYLATDFRMPSWVHSFLKQWWNRLTMYVLEKFEDELKHLGLYEAVQATCYRIEVNVPNFYSIFELYHPLTGMFFTLIEDLELAFHEMGRCRNSLWAFFHTRSISYAMKNSSS